MKKTKKEINSLMESLKIWGLTDGLSKVELDTIRQRLQNIASCAVREATINLTLDMYNQIKTSNNETN